MLLSASKKQNNVNIHMYLLIADDLENVLKMLGTELESILFSSHFRIYVFDLSLWSELPNFAFKNM